MTHNREPVKGAVVMLEDTKTLQVRSYVTGPNGRYHFADLQTDIDYQVWAEHGKRKSSKEYFSRFNTNPNTRLDLKIE